MRRTGYIERSTMWMNILIRDNRGVAFILKEVGRVQGEVRKGGRKVSALSLGNRPKGKARLVSMVASLVWRMNGVFGGCGIYACLYV